MRAQIMAGLAGLLMAVAACSGSADPNYATRRNRRRPHDEHAGEHDEVDSASTVAAP